MLMPFVLRTQTIQCNYFILHGAVREQGYKTIEQENQRKRKSKATLQQNLKQLTLVLYYVDHGKTEDYRSINYERVRNPSWLYSIFSNATILLSILIIFRKCNLKN